MIKQRVTFTNIKEHFSEYEVENGQILKVKLVLTDIVTEVNEDGTQASYLEFKDVNTVITDSDIDTSNLEYAPTEQVTEKDHVKELKFKPIEEAINIYETKKFLFFVALIVKKVFQTNKKSKNGQPILRYNYDRRISTIDKSSILHPSPDLQQNQK